MDLVIALITLVLTAAALIAVAVLFRFGAHQKTVTEQILSVVTEVDKAVNGKPRGETTISEDVTSIMSEARDRDTPGILPAVQKLTQDVAEIKRHLKAPPTP